jgi:hypothetical protein
MLRRKEFNRSMRLPVAYLVLAHADPTQCIRLIRGLLADRDAHVFFQLDLKAKEDFSGVVTLSSSRVHFVKERYEVSWGGYSIVRAILAAIREAVNFNVEFGYLVLLSGMDYPTKHPDEIKDYLYSQPFRQHINRLNIADSPEHYLKLARQYIFRDAWLPAGKIDKYVRRAASILAIPFRRRLLNGTICTGSMWWALTPEFGRYVLDTAARDTAYEKYFKFLHGPDEVYFHTVLQNSPFVDEAPPVLAYQGRGMWRTANLHLIHPSLRKIYTEAEFNEVMAANRCFVRKVNTVASSKLLDQIDDMIGLTPVPETDRQPTALSS